MKKLFLTLPLLLVASINAKDLAYDKTTSLLWQDSFDNVDLAITHNEASQYCSKLVVDDYSSFRLPTVEELQSIIDLKKYKPAIINGFKYVDTEYYWSSTPYAGDKSEFWAISFKSGESNTISENYDRHVRCVKSVK
ncbi:MAG: DUF1566 domain-containing protein [Campylobacterota bacterium]|nr:DUF1566 domain-containing protein [Campylobacterota bacterium]